MTRGFQTLSKGGIIVHLFTLSIMRNTLYAAPRAVTMA